MTSMDILVKLGRFMITTAPKFADDAQFNNWARVGSQLTELGMPFAPALREFDPQDQQIVRDAAAVMSGRADLPEQMMAPTEIEQPRRTRRARMTQAMSRPARPKAATALKSAKKAVKSVTGETKRRGRPPGSKNKPKAAVAAKKTTAKKTQAVTANKRGRPSKKAV